MFKWRDIGTLGCLIISKFSASVSVRADTEEALLLFLSELEATVVSEAIDDNGVAFRLGESS